MYRKGYVERNLPLTSIGGMKDIYFFFLMALPSVHFFPLYEKVLLRRLNIIDIVLSTLTITFVLCSYLLQLWCEIWVDSNLALTWFCISIDKMQLFGFSISMINAYAQKYIMFLAMCNISYIMSLALKLLLNQELMS